ncbi:hypothetical protein [Catenuloplanes atrovinosus]|uniref:Uncharacterized protein n=1 Tax=Catenuloplanes atrovinosus TaxID=137266 RepID=A0AAE4CBZ5_9ACTN|nr:hypothetical protein [Catenuloplanes atrovinosus]
MTARPLYARMLRLRHLTPGGLLCFVYLEGAFGLGILLALAELVTWWGILVLPASIAVMVKLNDVIAGVGARHPSRGTAGAAVRRDLAARAATAQAEPSRDTVDREDGGVHAASTDSEVYGAAHARGAADVRTAAGSRGLDGTHGENIRPDTAPRTAGPVGGRGPAGPRFAGQKVDPEPATELPATPRHGTVYGTASTASAPDTDGGDGVRPWGTAFPADPGTRPEHAVQDDWRLGGSWRSEGPDRDDSCAGGGGQADQSRTPAWSERTLPLRQTGSAGTGEPTWPGQVDRTPAPERSERTQPLPRADAASTGEPSRTAEWSERTQPLRNTGAAGTGEPSRTPEWSERTQPLRQAGAGRTGEPGRPGGVDGPGNPGRRPGVPSGRRSNESYRLPPLGQSASGGGRAPTSGGAPSARRAADGGLHRFPDQSAPRSGGFGGDRRPAGEAGRQVPGAGHGRRSAEAPGRRDGDVRIDPRSDAGRHSDTPQQRARQSATRRYE